MIPSRTRAPRVAPGRGIVATGRSLSTRESSRCRMRRGANRRWRNIFPTRGKNRRTRSKPRPGSGIVHVPPRQKQRNWAWSGRAQRPGRSPGPQVLVERTASMCRPEVPLTYSPKHSSPDASSETTIVCPAL
jgi:hypothetical protein